MSIENECGSKRRYETKAAAKRAEKHLRTAAGGSRQHAYRCQYCGFWHCGHSTERRYHADYLAVMIQLAQDELETAQTPTQRRYFQNQLSELEIEHAEALELVNVVGLKKAM